MLLAHGHFGICPLEVMSIASALLPVTPFLILKLQGLVNNPPLSKP